MRLLSPWKPVGKISSMNRAAQEYNSVNSVFVRSLEFKTGKQEKKQCLSHCYTTGTGTAVNLYWLFLSDVKPWSWSSLSWPCFTRANSQNNFGQSRNERGFTRANTSGRGFSESGDLLLDTSYGNNNSNNNNVYGAVIVAQSHCESSPGSCDEYGTASSGRRPSDQAKRPGL